MATTLTPTPESAAERPAQAPAWRAPLVGVLLALAVFAVRAFLNHRSYDVFVDEVTYGRLGQSVAHHFTLDLYGKPFFLHPPAAFLVEAIWLKLAPDPNDAIALVYSLRWLVFVLAALTAIVVWQVTRSLAGRWAGAAAGLLFLLDPFLNRINSRVLLETQTLLFVLMGLGALLVPWSRRQSVTMPRAALAGVLLGLGVLTKDTALLGIAPALAYFVFADHGRFRRQGLLAAATLVLTYLPYPLLSAVVGHWQQFIDQKTQGVLRLGGVVQLTGFNAPGAASFSSRIVQRLEFFAASYAVMAVAAVLTLWLLWRRPGPLRMLALWSAASYGLAAYSVLKGTLEEQLFYFVMIPSIVVVPVAIAAWVHPPTEARRRQRRSWIAGVALVLWLIPALVAYTQVHTTRDDAYPRMVTYIASLSKPGNPVTVGVTSDPASFLLRKVRVSSITSVADLRRTHVQYVLVSEAAVRDGTSTITPPLRRVLADATVVHSVSGPSVGVLQLLAVPPEIRDSPSPASSSAQAAGSGSAGS